MKKGLLCFDFIVQALLLSLILAGFLAAPITLDLLVFSLLGSLMLGAWQLSSGLLKALALPSHLHGYYVASAVGYLLLLVGGIALSATLHLNLQPPGYHSSLTLWLPAAFGAVWYTRQSWKDWQQALQSNPPVFV